MVSRKRKKAKGEPKYLDSKGQPMDSGEVGQILGEDGRREQYAREDRNKLSREASQERRDREWLRIHEGKGGLPGPPASHDPYQEMRRQVQERQRQERQRQERQMQERQGKISQLKERRKSKVKSGVQNKPIDKKTRKAKKPKKPSKKCCPCSKPKSKLHPKKARSGKVPIQRTPGMIQKKRRHRKPPSDKRSSDKRSSGSSFHASDFSDDTPSPPQPPPAYRPGLGGFNRSF